MKRLLSAIMLALLLNATTTGRTSEPIKPVPQNLFSPVFISEASEAPLDLIVESFKDNIPTSRPSIDVPKIEPKQEPKAPVIVITGKSTKGVASWYCKTGVSRCTKNHPGGLYAAIRKDLLYLRGKTIKVTYNGKAIYVRVIDCNCGPNANLIDLYSDAFKQLAPLSRGAIKVTVSW